MSCTFIAAGCEGVRGEGRGQDTGEIKPSQQEGGKQKETGSLGLYERSTSVSWEQKHLPEITLEGSRELN